MHMLVRSTFREIRGSLGRYIAIFAIIALGVGLFAGLKVTKPAMVSAADNYVNEYSLYDFRLISTLGFTDDDIEAFSGLSGVKNAVGSVSADFISESGLGDELVLSAHSITDGVNDLALVSGRMPQNGSECVVDAKRFSENMIGSVIKVASDNSEDTSGMFKYSEYTIVGTVNSVLYMNFERGSTSIGNGSVTAFIFIPYEGFDVDCYTEAFLTADTKGEIYSGDYTDSIDEMKQSVEDLCRERADIRYEKLVSDAQSELDEKKAELADSRSELDSKENETYAALADTYSQINSGMEQVSDAEDELTATERQLDDAQSQLDGAKKQVADSRAQFDQQTADAAAKYNSAKSDLTAGIAACDSALAAIAGQGLTDKENELNAQKAALQQSLQQLEAQYAQAQLIFEGSESEIENAEAQLHDKQVEIDSGYMQLASGWQELSDKKAELQDGLSEYESALADAKEQFSEAEAKISDGEMEIADAQSKIDSIEKADVYVLDRTKNVGYASFKNDSEIVEGISNVFPMFFLLIAALVCITTMTRMVDEQRTTIGVLRALGYSESAIMGKYLFYSGSASLLGCAAGFFAGTYVFPKTIWKAYSIMYSIGGIEYYFDPLMLILSTAIYLACAMAATWSTCRSELGDAPAELIRPKTPKSGKRVFLEYIGVLWKRFSFLQKVSARNILRYKKRLFMMLLGVGGCTALLITGFGINDSIKNVVDYQYNEIMLYDEMVNFDKPLDSDSEQTFIDDVSDVADSALFIHDSTQDVSAGDASMSANMIVTDSSDISAFIDMHNGKEKIAVPQDGEAVISAKIAKQLGVGVGDTIRISSGSGKDITASVSGVFDNYVYHYVIISSATYISQCGEAPEYKTALVNLRDGVDPHEAVTKLASESNAASVSVNKDMRERIDTSMSSLNYIIILVIICAGALAFIVIYNLTNININERIREIATIKVLGFYAGESAAYVFRENMLMTVAGAIIGLPLGKLLHLFVMSQINIDMMAFDVRISFWSYLISFALTIVFACIVDFFMYFRLEKINMAESLKSIE